MARHDDGVGEGMQHIKERASWPQHGMAVGASAGAPAAPAPPLPILLLLHTLRDVYVLDSCVSEAACIGESWEGAQNPTLGAASSWPRAAPKTSTGGLSRPSSPSAPPHRLFAREIRALVHRALNRQLTYTI